MPSRVNLQEILLSTAQCVKRIPLYSGPNGHSVPPGLEIEKIYQAGSNIVWHDQTWLGRQLEVPGSSGSSGSVRLSSSVRADLGFLFPLKRHYRFYLILFLAYLLKDLSVSIFRDGYLLGIHHLQFFEFQKRKSVFPLMSYIIILATAPSL